MKRNVLVFAGLLFPAFAIGAPHLYGDVQAGVTSCGMVLDGAPKVVMPVVAGGSCSGWWR